MNIMIYIVIVFVGLLLALLAFRLITDWSYYRGERRDLDARSKALFESLTVRGIDPLAAIEMVMENQKHWEEVRARVAKLNKVSTAVEGPEFIVFPNPRRGVGDNRWYVVGAVKEENR